METEPGQTTPLALIVEDQPDMAALEAAMLAQDGFDTVVVGDPEAAVEILTSRIADVVLLDLRLGAADGLQLLSYIRREMGSRPPVVIVSGHISPDLETYLELFSNVSVLPKSRIHDLRGAVASAVSAAIGAAS